MKKLILGLAVLLACVTMPQAQTIKDSAAEARKARRIELSRPGKYHQLLYGLVGDWTFAGKHFLPGDRIIEFHGTGRRKPIMGGRFFIFETTAEKIPMPWLDNKEAVYQDLSLEGYDNEQAAFFTATVENHWTTGLLTVQGLYDSSAGTITVKGSTTSSGATRPTRQVLTLIDPDHYRMENFIGDQAGNRTSLIVYSRVPQPKTTEALIRGLEQQGVTGILHSDTAILSRIWAPEFIVTTPRNTIAESRSAVFRNMKAGLISYKTFTRDIERILVEDGVVVTMGLETYIAAADMPEARKDETITRRFTNVWMLKDGNWLQVARHASVISK